MYWHLNSSSTGFTRRVAGDCVAWKLLGLTILLLTLIVTVSAHASDEVASIDTAERTLRVASWIDYANPQHRSAWDDVLARWEEKYPDVKIELQFLIGGYSDKLMVLFATGEMPDVFDITLMDIPIFLEAGALLNLTPYMERDLSPEDYFQASLGRGRFPHPDGDIYTAWTMMSPTVVYVNKDIFDAAGIIIPAEGWHYDNMLGIAKKLWRDSDGDRSPEQVGMAAGYDGGYASWTGYGTGPVLLSFGLDRLWNGTRYELNTPEAIAGWTHIRELMAEGVAPTGWGTNPFLDGKSGLVHHGMYWTPTVNDVATFNWTTVPPMSGTHGARVSLHGNPSMGISSTTPDPELAWAFVHHVMDSQTAHNVYLQGNAPAKRTAAYEWLAEGAEIWPGFNPEAARLSIENSVFFPAVSLNQGDINKTIHDLMRPAMLGQVSIVGALQEAERLANAMHIPVKVPEAN